MKEMIKFSKNDLPFNDAMNSFWDKNGFIVIKDFYSTSDCDKLRNRAKTLIENFDPNEKSFKSIFDTNNQKHSEDKYFLNSGDKIRFFFESKAFDKNGKLSDSIDLVINKIGHALHDLDKEFFDFTHKISLNNIAQAIGIKSPKILQSMYIFKQPKIGGEVTCHQDSTFLYTEPESATGFWIALEDANIENGCLWAAAGGHKGPLRKLFKRSNNKMEMITLNDAPFEKLDTPLEVKKGSLVILHGRLPHYSCENTSPNSRHAYTIHVIDQSNDYPDWNWLQRPELPLKSFIND